MKIKKASTSLKSYGKLPMYLTLNGKAETKVHVEKAKFSKGIHK